MRVDMSYVHYLCAYLHMLILYTIHQEEARHASPAPTCYFTERVDPSP